MGSKSSSWHATGRRLTRRNFLRQGFVAAGALGAGVLGLSMAGCQAGAPATSNTAPSTPTAEPAVKVTVSYDGTPNDMPLFIAHDQGILAKHGIDATLVPIAGPTSVAAVLSGQVQVGHSGGSEVIGAAIQGGDAKIVAVQSPVFPFLFMVQSSIKTPADLRGKKVGISNPGGAADTALRIVLPKLGLQPDDDVTFISMGSIANQVAGLQSGAIDGTIIVDGPDTYKMQNAGFPSLFDVSKLDIPYVDAVIELQGSFIDSHKGFVQNYIDAMIESTLLMRSNKDVAIQALNSIFQGNAADSYPSTYDYYSQTNVTVVPPLPKVEDFKNTIDILCKREADACNFDANKMIDASFVQSAISRGLTKG
jgi:ABC-type nitrate/sulfonate/bicarbonate transport system substrate-binding protein